MNELPNQIAQDTSLVMDITGRENTLILLALPGEEVTACCGVIAEASARGRPPFVVILGMAPRMALRLWCRGGTLHLGLPADGSAFRMTASYSLGCGKGAFPATRRPLFKRFWPPWRR
jgi:hypothetical protein